MAKKNAIIYFNDSPVQQGGGSRVRVIFGENEANAELFDTVEALAEGETIEGFALGMDTFMENNKDGYAELFSEGTDDSPSQALDARAEIIGWAEGHEYKNPNFIVVSFDKEQVENLQPAKGTAKKQSRRSAKV